MAAEDLSEFAVELHELARCKSVDSAAAMPLPLLTRLVGEGLDGRNRIAAMADAIKRASEEWEDPRFRHGASEIFLDDKRWRTGLGVRQRRAGEFFGLTTQSGWTKPGRDGSASYHKELLEGLASRMIGRATRLASVGSFATPQDSLVQAEIGRPRSDLSTHRHSFSSIRRNLRVVHVGVALAVVLALLWVFVAEVGSGAHPARSADGSPPSPATVPSVEGAPTSSIRPPTSAGALSDSTVVSTRPPAAGGPSPTSFSPAPCRVPIAQPSGSLSSADLQRLKGMKDVFVAVANGRCASGPVEAFGVGLLQNLGTDGADDGAIVVPPDGVPVALSQGAWNSYREIAGRGKPDQSWKLAGYPTTVEITARATVVSLSLGGVLVGALPNSVYFWIPQYGDAVAKWRAAGGLESELGLPTSNPFQPGSATLEQWYSDSWYLEFEHGYMTSPPTLNPSQVKTVQVDNPMAPIDGIGDVVGRVLTQVGGQAWFIDRSRVVHWIGDLATWNCLGGDRLLLHTNIPGYTIASFTRGADATCDLLTT
jgi:hypothetical protein